MDDKYSNGATSSPRLLQRLQTWYHSQCDGDWEHSYGIKITTLDNPGWAVVVDLARTNLATSNRSMSKDLDSELDWLVCKIEHGVFTGHGGPYMLESIVEQFLDWAAGHET